MDMTQMQFMDYTFNVILDKGGLDALMEPEHGPQLGNQYLSEKLSSKPDLQTFMVVVEKENSNELHQIMSSFSHSTIGCNPHQAYGLHEALESENQILGKYLSESKILYSLKDLQLGAKGDLTKHSPGRRVQLALRE
ncbi:hypothetical protein REPUB_Repub16aG0068700 [Reevesia pubescens]